MRSNPNDSVTACSGPSQYAPKLSMTPSTSPPTIAPGTLPIDDTDMAAQGTLLNDVAELVDRGLLKTTLTNLVSGPIEADTLRRAHELVETGRTIGKVVVGGER